MTNRTKEIESLRGSLEALQDLPPEGKGITAMPGKKKIFSQSAEKLMNKMQEFAKTTPFQLPQVVQGTKTLLAMGIETEKVLDTMRSLGDVSAGLGVDLNRLILNYGQVKTQTKLTGMELRDFLRAGVPLISELSKNLNVSEAKIKELTSAGKIGFAEVEKAFQTMTGAGGKFANLMEKQSGTLVGQISNLQDSIGELSRGIGAELLPVVKLIVGAFRSLVDLFNKMPRFMKVFVAALIGITFAVSAVLTGVGAFLAILPFLSGALAAVGVSASIAFAGIPILIGAAVTALVVLARHIKGLSWLMDKITGTGKRQANASEAQVRRAAMLAGLDPDEEVEKWKNKKAIDTHKATGGTGLPPVQTFDPVAVDYSKELEEFEKSERLKTEILEKSLSAQRDAIIAAEEKLQDLNLTDEARALAEIELEKQKNQEKLDLLDAFYASTQEKEFANKEEELALDEFYNEQKLILLNTQIDLEIAAKERQYEFERAINLKTAKDFLNLIDFKKKMNQSQAEDFMKWESFMAGAVNSKSKEISAIAKAMSIYNITLKASEAAMSAYAALSGIPIVGPALGIAAAAAAIAYGAEQIGTVSNTQPALAEGGIVMPRQGGRSVTVGEGGEPEGVFPLDSSEAKDFMGGDNSDKPIVLQIDGQELASAMVRGYKKGRKLRTVDNINDY